MQIALIADHFEPLGSGSDRAPSAEPYPGDDSAALLGLARAMAELDQDVTIYARKDTAQLPARFAVSAGICVEYLEAGPAALLPPDKMLAHIAAFAGQLAGRWRQRRPAVVHGQSWTASMAALAGARGLGLPVVQTFRPAGPAPRSRRGRAAAARARLEAAAGRTADAVVASHSAAVSELTRLGVAPAAIKLVPPGVDTSFFHPNGPSARRGDRARLLMVTSSADESESAAVLPALTHLRGVELVIAGGPGSGGRGRDRASRGLTRFARQLGLADRLVLAGPLNRPDAPALLRSADLLVNLASTHPFDAVTLDAMACGVPVLAAAAGGLPADAIVDGVTGFLLPSAAPGPIADRIHRFLTSPMAAEGYGIAAASRAQERYAWARIGREMLAVYQSVAPAGAGTAAQPPGAQS
jgi:glycosyltransferase involved in cell wall biosynthesis